MGREAKFRKDLSMPGMLAEARRCFERVEDRVPGRGLNLADCLMSGLAVFSLKHPSLLRFEQDARGLGDGSDGTRRENLRTLFGIERAPSDVRLRERLDELDPAELRRPFKRLFGLAQRGGVPKDFEWLGGRHLLSVDGTGHFSSPTVHCANCCVKERADGGREYYHQSLCGAGASEAPGGSAGGSAGADPEQDGATKNDCERNAAKRLPTDLRREHPHLPLLVVEDGLASNGPHVRLLKGLGMRFVLGAKRGDHAALFEWVDELESAPPAPGVERWETVDGDGVEHRFRWSNGAPLNGANADLEVNFLEYRERRPNGKERRFSWVTDLRVGRWNAMDPMCAGRARWRIENETFNTLKNQGCEFEHNFGHGRKHPHRRCAATGVRRADAAGVRHRPAAEGVLPAVPGGAGQGDASELLLGDFQGHVPERRRRRLGNAVQGAGLRPPDGTGSLRHLLTPRPAEGVARASASTLRGTTSPPAKVRPPAGAGSLSASKTAAPQPLAFDRWRHLAGMAAPSGLTGGRRQIALRLGRSRLHG